MKRVTKSKILIAFVVPLLLITAIFSIKNTFAFSTTSIKVGSTTVTLDSLKQGQLYVGYGKASIDPDLEKGGVPLQGFANTQNRVATASGQQYKQPLYATAVAIMDKDKNVVIFVTVDLCSIYSETIINNMKKKVTEKTGIPGERVLISLTHTHSGPQVEFSNSAYQNLVDAIKLYKEKLYNQIANASADALKDLSPADISIGTTNVVNADGTNALNFVRNYKAKPKNAKYDITVNRGQQNNSSVYLADEKKWITEFEMVDHQTKADPALQLIKFKKSKGKDIVMINWQVHPVITGTASLTTISSDFINSLRENVEKEFNCRVAYFSGASGNINPYTEVEKEKNELTTRGSTAKDTYDKSISYGKKLSEYVAKIYNKTKKVSGEYVNLKRKKVKVNYKDVSNVEAVNATYVNEINKASYANVAKMIEGSYKWPENFKFPKDFDASGAKLRQIIKFSPYLQQVFILTGNDQTGYKCVAKNVTSSHRTKFISYLGSMFEDYKIHGGTHASTLVSAFTRVGDSTTVELNAVSLGSVSFATAQYEMFDTSGMSIKKDSPSKMTFVLSLTNGKKGYIPTKDVYAYGSYETNITYFPKGTAEKLSEELVRMLKAVTVSVKEETKIPITSIKINSDLSEIRVNETFELTVDIKPSNATNKNITWKSSDTSIVTVEAGLITGISPGSATITATSKDGKKSDSITIAVKEGQEIIPKPDIKTDEGSDNTLLIASLVALGVLFVVIYIYAISKRKNREYVQESIDYQDNQNNINYQNDDQQNFVDINSQDNIDYQNNQDGINNSNDSNNQNLL